MTKAAGRLTLYTGPMGSGKSSYLVRRLNSEPGSVLIKPKMDTRGFISRDPEYSLNKDVEQIFVENLSEYKIKKGTRYIGIDEANFFTDLVPQVLRFLNKGVNVLVSGLLLTSELKNFNNVSDLLPHCDTIIQLKAICKYCKGDAIYTHYIGKDEKTGAIKVGGAESYISLCRRCKQKEIEKNGE